MVPQDWKPKDGRLDKGQYWTVLGWPHDVRTDRLARTVAAQVRTARCARMAAGRGA